MVSKKQGLTGGVAISLAAVLWGLDGVVLTPRLHHLPIDYVVFVFHMIPFLLMSVIFRRQFRYITQFNRSDYLFITLIALFGGALGTLSIVKALFLVGFKKLSIVVLLQKLQPVFGIVLAALILKERMAKRISAVGLAGNSGWLFSGFWIKSASHRSG
ncbi:MAG: EamA family transporter [Bacteroidales bacterium]|nr:EamA family transporter [Bacteroidales bacterium]